MADYRIEIGATDGFRYIGVKPPLDAEQKQEALTVLEDDIIFQGTINGSCLRTTDGRVPYTELAVTTTLYRERVPAVAVQLAGVLKRQGHTVQVDLQPRNIDGDGNYRLFGNKSNAHLNV
jgi:hypothetical protein